MLKKLQHTILLLLISASLAMAQKSLLQAGPMLGYSQMREALVWVQTTESADVQIKYFLNKDSEVHSTQVLTTEKPDAYTAKLLADEVEPGNTYQYELYINNKLIEFDYELSFQTLELWQWRDDPPEFSFAAGSCAYINEKEYDRPGTPYGGDYEIFDSIYEKGPDFMLWLGDNVYFREVDWNSRTGIIKRYTHDRSIPELQPLFSTVHNYAIWDDHDFGPNNSDRSFWNKETTLEAFKLFWGNPSYGVNGSPGITTYFEWGDAAFFLLDNRYNRSPNNRDYVDKRTILGEEQIQWLIDALSSSRAPFKFVVMGGQFLNPVPTYETYATFPKERAEILQKIEQEGIEGVIFLSGDRHITEISKFERRETYPLYDFTISPLTSGPANAKDDPNYLRIDGTLVEQRNFAVFNISGKRKDRKLECKVYDKEGKELINYTIKENELKN